VQDASFVDDEFIDPLLSRVPVRIVPPRLRQLLLEFGIMGFFEALGLATVGGLEGDFYLGDAEHVAQSGGTDRR
jgi:hypothetical protein